MKTWSEFTGILLSLPPILTQGAAGRNDQPNVPFGGHGCRVAEFCAIGFPRRFPAHAKRRNDCIA